MTKNFFIDVSDAYAEVPYTYSESFENSTNFFNYWRTYDLDNNAKTWWLSPAAGYTGSYSVKMNAYSNYAYDVDQLISPSYNLSYLTSPVLTFRCAAATKATLAADLNDVLKVWASKDCGATWGTVKTLTGTTLINNGYHPEEYVPSSSTQWDLHTANISSLYITANTRFKFEYTSGLAGNSIYLDDINITGVLGVEENTIDESNVSIYPNPANQTATLSYHLDKKGDAKIEVLDVLGKKIMEVNSKDQAEGDHSVHISKQDLNMVNGIYFVKFTIGGNTITKKLIISE
ncbi:MAG: T9SS type A sorting domain-containing protein [Bacteroidetes bacterium]|nr:T9SS type A sorting domain-containing protein [Bacteroidota bacterium]